MLPRGSGDKWGASKEDAAQGGSKLAEAAGEAGEAAGQAAEQGVGKAKQGLGETRGQVRSVMPSDRKADQVIGKIDRGAGQNYRQTDTSHYTAGARVQASCQGAFFKGVGDGIGSVPGRGCSGGQLVRLR